MNLLKKKAIRQRRIWRIRKKVNGTPERPRMCIHISNKHIYVQAIDDVAGKTLADISTLQKEVVEQKIKANMDGATKLGGIFAERAKKAGIEKVVYDRHGRPYHGLVKAFAEAARKGGLVF